MMQRLIANGAGALLLCCLLLLNGCATPVGVKLVSPSESYKDAYANPLSVGVISDQAKYVLNRYYLLQKFDSDPAGVIAELHEKALHDDRRDILYALAEVSYLHGEQLTKSTSMDEQRSAPDYFLLSALYAYYFFFEERSEPPPNALDRRARIAVDLYNFGLWQALQTGEGGALALEGMTRQLPFGRLSISLDTGQLPWKMDEFERFEPADKYMARGFSVRNRTAGIGVPLIGLKKDTSDSFAGGSFAGGQAVALTAFLRIQGNLASLSAGTATASLELYSAQDTATVLLNNREIPLDTDTTTPMAYKLEGAKVWGWGVSAFLGKEIGKSPDGLYLQQPYRPGKIPVVFVHGTASSPVWWAEMFNTLYFDPLIRKKYQFWYYVYTSNKPILMSAADLRDALAEKVAALDPEVKDPALRQMVVIGHSQGGLLTKLCAVDTGESLVRTITGKDLEDLKMPAGKKGEARRLLIVKPLPFVKEVVFLSTPHRGSFRSKGWNRNLVRWIVSFPAKLLQTTKFYYDYMTDDFKKQLGGKKVFTSADGMSPDNPVLKTLVDIPLAPGVKGHSIIAVKGDGDPKLGNDGVVEYSSAHLDGMESEFIVRSDHSSQLNPLAIDEVRRILVEHVTDASTEIAVGK
jgi:pimeloyl-ACP methyl ester carboxylesterase